MTLNNRPHSLPPLQHGDLLMNGHYEIIDLTSNPGGFGRIYRAYGSRFDKNGKGVKTRHVTAIKEFHVREMAAALDEWSAMYSYTRAMTEQDMKLLRAKFYQEAKMLKVLYHQRDRHLPYIHGEAWEEPDGRLFYAMTYIDGLTLRETLVDEGRPMDEERAIDYIIQVAKVLHKAHETGMVHADVSPNNIMLKRNRHFAVLVDWGNAKSYNHQLTLESMNEAQLEEFQRYQADLDNAVAGSGLQSMGSMPEMKGIGTGGYTAPREFWGKPQADVYSLAATLFYLLTGKDARTLSRDNYFVWARNLLTEHNVSAATTEAILHAMTPDIHTATQSIHDFLMELEHSTVINVLLNYTDHD